MRRLAVLVLLVAAACAGDGPSAREVRFDQAHDAAVEAGLPDDVATLLGDAAAGIEGTYRVTYAFGDGPEVVVTQRPPDRRIDYHQEDGTVDSTISVDGETHACTDPAGDEPVRCGDVGRPEDPGVLDADAVAAFITAIGANVDRYTFDVEERELAGTDARCLVTELRAGEESETLGDEGTFCIAPTGAILLVGRPVGRFEATAYTTDVPDDAFTLPAGTG